MRKKMYWGVASLIIIIGVVGVYFMLQPEPEPETRYKLPSEADLEQARETKQPPPGASPNGHWHDDEWHDESHQTPIVVAEEPVAVDVPSQDSNVSMDTLSDEEFRKLYTENFTKEELAEIRRIELEKFPKIIEQLKKSIAQAEQVEKDLLEKAKKYTLSEFEKEYLEDRQREIDSMKVSLAGHQRILEVMYGVK